jgi:hypothetical protein
MTQGPVRKLEERNVTEFAGRTKPHRPEGGYPPQISTTSKLSGSAPVARVHAHVFDFHLTPFDLGSEGRGFGARRDTKSRHNDG